MARRKSSYGYTPETHRDRARAPIGAFRRLASAFKIAVDNKQCAAALSILSTAVRAKTTAEIEQTYAVYARGAAAKRSHYRKANIYVQSPAMGSKIHRMESAYINKCLRPALRRKK